MTVIVSKADDGRVWVGSTDENGDGLVSSIRDVNGLWTFGTSPAPDDLKDNFSRVTDAKEASALVQDAREAASSMSSLTDRGTSPKASSREGVYLALEEDQDLDEELSDYPAGLFPLKAQEKCIVDECISIVRKALHSSEITPNQVRSIGTLIFALERMPHPTPGVAIIFDATYGFNNESRFYEINISDKSFVLSDGGSVDYDGYGDVVFEVELSGYRSAELTDIWDWSPLAGFFEAFNALMAGTPKIKIDDLTDYDEVDLTTDLTNPWDHYPSSDAKEGPDEQMTYKVLVDDNFHFMDEDERDESGHFTTYEEAVAAAKAIVDESLRWERRQCKNPHDPDELYERYTDFGDDPFVKPEPEGQHFSAWDFAKQRCPEICAELYEKESANQ